MRNEKTAPAEIWSGFVKLFYPVIVIVSTENFSKVRLTPQLGHLQARMIDILL